MIGFSGYYSKDAIIAQALSFKQANSNPWCGAFYYVAAGGAAITAFYMFRLWYMTFAGKPRDHHVYEHAHESPKVMYVPLVILAVFALVVGWPVLGFAEFAGAGPAGGSVGDGDRRRVCSVAGASERAFVAAHASRIHDDRDDRRHVCRFWPAFCWRRSFISGGC